MSMVSISSGKTICHFGALLLPVAVKSLRRSPSDNHCRAVMVELFPRIASGACWNQDIFLEIGPGHVLENVRRVNSVDPFDPFGSKRFYNSGHVNSGFVYDLSCDGNDDFLKLCFFLLFFFSISFFSISSAIANEMEINKTKKALTKILRTSLIHPSSFLTTPFLLK